MKYMLLKLYNFKFHDSTLRGFWENQLLQTGRQILEQILLAYILFSFWDAEL